MELITHKKRKYTYVMSKNIISTDDFENVTVYGISITYKKKSSSIEDISDNYIFVKHLFEQIIEEHLYPDHLFDVVEDFLIEYDPKKFPISIAHKYPYIA